jgi:hypothetical protein
MKSAAQHGRGRLATPSGLVVAVLLATLAVTGGTWGRAAAQEATPTVECAPPVGDGGPVATPVEAEPAASPVPAEEPVGEPADEATAAAVAAAAENVVACWNAGNLSAFLDLVTDSFIANDLAYADRDEAANALTSALAMGALPALSVLELDSATAMTYDDGRASIDIVFMQGEYQYVEARWFFVESGSDLLLDEETFLNPEPDVDFVTFIQATLAAEADSTVAFDQSTTLPATDAIVIQLLNNSDDVKQFQVLQLAEGTALNEDGTLPENALEGAVQVGSAVVEGGGGRASIALIDLPPGLYVLVDSETGEGPPLTVTEPAE